ncbi:MAG TPA: helix-turn-helix domain-containing protein [Flavobacteriaceae bacterium]
MGGPCQSPQQGIEGNHGEDHDRDHREPDKPRGQSLLRETTWTISEIAHSLGFEEVAHFSNFFKRKTKMSPLSYRI